MASESLRDIWFRFKVRGDARARETLIDNYSYLVKITAGRIAGGVPPSLDPHRPLPALRTDLAAASQWYGSAVQGFDAEKRAYEQAVADAAAAREAMPKSTVPVPEGWPASPNLQVLGISSLTNRQRQILELLMDGRSSKEIGAILGNSTRTIEGHRSRILQKMNARNNSDLMRKILSH